MGRKNNKGFTLVELMIVVSILAFIAIIAIAYFRGQLFKGNDARRKSDLNRISIAIEEYEKDHNCYPLPYIVSCSPGTGLQPYLEKTPCDPRTNSTYEYEYEESACPSWYRIYTVLDNPHDSAVTEGIGPGSAFNYYRSSTNAPGINESSDF
jgi:prepilin-type N-terminal cleavage/methylation domain-containing protein